MLLSDVEVVSAICLICRNSVSSAERTSLITQVIRSHVSSSMDHRDIANQRVQEITIQIKKRGYI